VTETENQRDVYCSNWSERRTKQTDLSSVQKGVFSLRH